MRISGLYEKIAFIAEHFMPFSKQHDPSLLIKRAIKEVVSGKERKVRKTGLGTIKMYYDLFGRLMGLQY